MNDVEDIMKTGMFIFVNSVLRQLQDDPHQWSDRPCPTCCAVSAIVHKPFGCYEYQRQRAKREEDKDEL